MDYESFVESKRFEFNSVGIDIERPLLHPMLFDFQQDITKWALMKGRAAIFAGTGLGKCHGIDTPIIMHDGTLKMVQDIVHGDLLMGPDSKPRTVISTTVGYGDLFRVIPIKGEPFVCNDVHVLSLKCTSDHADKYKKDEITNIALDEYLKQNKKFKHMMKLWRVGVQFEEKEIPIDPYVVGIWLGDGSINTPDITTGHHDTEVIEYLESWASKVGLIVNEKEIRSGCSTRSFVVGTVNNKPNHFRVFLKTCKSDEEKRIPTDYLRNSHKKRVELLAGLIDSDGYHVDNCFEIVTKFKGLAKDIAFLARSLGLGVTQKTVYKGIKETGFIGEYEKLIIYGDTNKVPCKVKRKQAQPRKQIKDALKTGFTVEYIGKGNYYGFELDGDHLYLLGDFTVTHNTLMQSEWAKRVHEHTGGNVLLLAPLAVASQTVKEARKIDLDITLCRTQADVKPGINITNYEMLHHFDLETFIGVVLDESSILKSYDSKTRTLIIDSFQNTPFRLACTATPAPNDYMELGNHSEFLGVMSRSEMLSMFFVHDGGETQKWRLKGHAEAKFWEWISSWGLMIRKPSDLGYEDRGYDLPPLNIIDHIVKVNKPLDGVLIHDSAKTLQERQQARRDSIHERVAKCAEIVNLTNRPFLVWCGLNSESEMLTKAIPDAVEVKGADSAEHKVKAMMDFADGKIRVLITKPSIAGFGMNWQHCADEAFVGITDSFEQIFQAIRRCYRFGQTKKVNVHMIVSDLEGAVSQNIKRKERDFEAMAEQMLKHTRKVLNDDIKASENEKIEYKPLMKMVIPSWLRSEAS